MRTVLPATVVTLLIAGCSTEPQPTVQLSAPPPPPAAFPPADVQPVPKLKAPDAGALEKPAIDVLAKQPRKGPTGSARTPRSFGVKECDRYARKACSCPDRLQRDRLCKDAHRSFGEWKKIAAHEGMRSFVVQSCKQSTRSIAAACR